MFRKSNWGSKLHLLTDGKGTPLHVILTAGNRHESTRFTALLDGVDVPQNGGRSRKRFVAIAADKGYSGYRNRRAVRERGMQSVIPQKSNEKARRARAFEFDRELSRVGT